MVLFSLLAQSALAGGYRIEVGVDDLFPRGDVNLAYHMGSKDYIHETRPLGEGNRVVFAGDEPLEPGIYMVTFPPDNRYAEFLVGEDQTFSMWFRGEDLLQGAKVDGSDENKAFFDVLRFQGDQRKRAEAVREQAGEVEAVSDAEKKRDAALRAINGSVWAKQDEAIAKHPDSLLAAVFHSSRDPAIPPEIVEADAQFDWYRAHFWDGFAFSHPGIVRTPMLESKVLRFVDKLTIQDPDNLVEAVTDVLERSRANPKVFKHTAVLLLNKYAKSNVVCQDKVYVHLVDSVYRTGQATWTDAAQVDKILAAADKLAPTLCGKKSPELVFPDANGTPQALVDVEAPLTVVWFYDPECGHCKVEGPKLAKVLGAYDSVGLYTVSTDPEGSAKALENWGFSRGTHVARVGEPDWYREWNIFTTPRVYVVDADKRILFKQIDAGQLDQVLARAVEALEAPTP